MRSLRLRLGLATPWLLAALLVSGAQLLFQPAAAASPSREAPMAVLGLAALPARGSDPMSFFSLCNEVSSAGYLMTLAGLAVFLLLLIDAIRGRFRAGHPPPVAP